MVGVTCVVAVAIAVAWAPAAQARPHLCKWAAGGGASLELEGGCHEKASRPTVHTTPLGSWTSVLYTAKWGVASVSDGPHHLLGVSLGHATGSSAVLEYLRKRIRSNILTHVGGDLVAASKGVLAGWSAETVACNNPPTGDCTLSNFQGLKGNWYLAVNVVGAPPGDPTAEEEPPSEHDEANDKAQEELLKGPTVGVGMAVLGGV
jgi:hypothetical protein